MMAQTRKTNRADRDGTVLRSVQAAFANWWSIPIVMVASAIAFDLVASAADIRLARALAYPFAVYQKWAHLPVIQLFRLADQSPPAAWIIDLFFLWVIVGAIVLRRAWIVRAAIIRSKSRANTNYDVWDVLLNYRWTLPFFLPFCFILWPAAVFYLIVEPHLHKNVKTESVSFFSWIDAEDGWTHLLDIRILLLAKTIATLLLLAAWVAGNAALAMMA